MDADIYKVLSITLKVAQQCLYWAMVIEISSEDQFLLKVKNLALKNILTIPTFSSAKLVQLSSSIKLTG